MAVHRIDLRPKPRPQRRFRKRFLLLLLLVFVLVGFFILRPFWRLTGQFDEITFRQPSRLYARPAVLEDERRYSLDQLVADLSAEGYREAEEGPRLPAGRFQRDADSLTVHLRSFPTAEGPGGGQVIHAGFRNGRIHRLEQDGRSVASVTLEPPLLASYYGDDLLERRPVTFDEVSQELVASVLAAEDANFFRHPGFSPSGVLRALWVNFRGGEIRQGGSTLTQQLVKNVYLSHERTWGRKGQELVLALLLEMRYTKNEILEAYLNEIYLGASGGVNLMGVGAASRAYFGKDASQLDLGEAATLAGMIRAPAQYSPLSHPEKAKERRDLVIRRLVELRRVDPALAEQVLGSPLSVAPEPLVRRRAPWFADAMTAEAQKRFGIDDLADGGYVLFSTLDWRDQRAAQEAVAQGVEKAERGYQRATKGAPLQAALVSLDAATGGILAYVGGRRYDDSQFDRAGQALRQPGSAFKPVVYAAAFEGGFFLPVSAVEDSPFTWAMAGHDWSPKNDDGSFHGTVTVRTALERSYNPATARIAQSVGIERIVALADKMGIPPRREPFPSIALGASEATPIELATVYATLAAGGVRPPVHGIAAALDRYGKPIAAAPLPAPKRVVSPQTTFMVTSLLQGVFERGTASGAASSDFFAGKTGTTNKRRDSWFAGFSPTRATVVWVGYDDNSVTRLSGARAALPIWIRFTDDAARRDGRRTFRQPKGLTTVAVDPTTGKLAGEYCPRIVEVFPEGKAPTEVCTQHTFYDTQVLADAGEVSGDTEVGIEEAADAAEEAVEEAVAEAKGKPHPFRRWLRKVFGEKDKDKGQSEDEQKPPAP
ncbi:MAG TPA: PBP1A family penicillin-binding protein [Thermoanaerobaculia bacterium]|nr:PBP1A family penicillin-binding protein [Thermoanaerobaculia bacterium]